MKILKTVFNPNVGGVDCAHTFSEGYFSMKLFLLNYGYGVVFFMKISSKVANLEPSVTEQKLCIHHEWHMSWLHLLFIYSLSSFIICKNKPNNHMPRNCQLDHLLDSVGVNAWFKFSFRNSWQVAMYSCSLEYFVNCALFSFETSYTLKYFHGKLSR